MRLLRVALPLFCAAFAARAQVSLGSYNANPAETTVSGISSGGYMAVQFGVSWSSIVRGAGVFAGGPFYCAQDDVKTAMSTCQIGSPDDTPLFSATSSYESAGAIDPTSNLARQKIWIFSGYNDGVVKGPVVDALYAYYAHYIDPGFIAYRQGMNAGHALITDGWGNPCDYTGPAFINNCGYDGAGLLLEHLFGVLNPRQTGTLRGSLIQFDQTQFSATDPWNISMSHTGYVYVPAACAAGAHCRVHVVFHGCKQDADDFTGTDFVNNAGYNQWADTNSFIVLYPQTVVSSTAPTNPNGCWDFWGYNESAYATKNGSQIRMVKAMVDRLTAGYDGWSAAPGGSFGAPQNLAAVDASPGRVALAWSAVGGASGYEVYRAGCSGCSFSKVNGALVLGPSFADSGLSAGQTYWYKVRAVSASGAESGDSAAVSRSTLAAPPACDPYYRDNYTHTAEGRAYAWYGYAYADGSNDFMGAWNISAETNLIQTGPGYFRAATCP